MYYYFILSKIYNGRRLEKIQYLGQYKNATEKGLWIGKNNEVPHRNRNIWENINVIKAEKIKIKKDWVNSPITN